MYLMSYKTNHYFLFIEHFLVIILFSVLTVDKKHLFRVKLILRFDVIVFLFLSQF